MKPKVAPFLILASWIGGWALLAVGLYGVLSWCAPGLPGWVPFAAVGGGVLVYEAVAARNLLRRSRE